MIGQEVPVACISVVITRNMAVDALTKKNRAQACKHGLFPQSSGCSPSCTADPSRSRETRNDEPSHQVQVAVQEVSFESTASKSSLSWVPGSQGTMRRHAEATMWKLPMDWPGVRRQESSQREVSLVHFLSFDVRSNLSSRSSAPPASCLDPSVLSDISEHASPAFSCASEDLQMHRDMPMCGRFLGFNAGTGLILMYRAFGYHFAPISHPTPVASIPISQAPCPYSSKGRGRIPQPLTGLHQALWQSLRQQRLGVPAIQRFPFATESASPSSPHPRSPRAHPAAASCPRCRRLFTVF